MNHPREDILALAASGDLPGFPTSLQAWRTRRHLSVCAECRATVEAYAQMRVEMSALPVPEPPANLAASILARMPRTDTPSIRIPWLAWAAASAVAALGVVMLVPSAPPLPPAPPRLTAHQTPPNVPAYRPGNPPAPSPNPALATTPKFASVAEAEADRDKRFLVTFATQPATVASNQPGIAATPLDRWVESARTANQHLPHVVVGAQSEVLRSHALPGRVEIVKLSGSPLEIVAAEASFADGHLIDPVVEVRNTGLSAIKDCQLIWVVRDAAGNEFRGRIVAANRTIAPGARAKFSETIVLAPERRGADTDIATARVFVRSASTPDSVWVPERGALEARNLGTIVPLPPATTQLLEAYRRDGVKALASLK